eukprot:104547-Pyramimonas_sp.AAC.1
MGAESAGGEALCPWPSRFCFFLRSCPGRRRVGQGPDLRDAFGLIVMLLSARPQVASEEPWERP